MHWPSSLGGQDSMAIEIVAELGAGELTGLVTRSSALNENKFKF